MLLTYIGFTLCLAGMILVGVYLKRETQDRVDSESQSKFSKNQLLVVGVAMVVIGLTLVALAQHMIDQNAALIVSALAIIFALLLYPKKKKEEEQKPGIPAEKSEEKKPAPVAIEEKKTSPNRTSAKDVIDDIWFYFRRIGIPVLLILLLFLFWPAIKELANVLRDRIKGNQTTNIPCPPAPVKTEEGVKKEDFVITGSDSKKVSDYVPKKKSKISGRRRLKTPPINWKGKGPCNSCPSGRKMR